LNTRLSLSVMENYRMRPALALDFAFFVNRFYSKYLIV